MCERLPVPQPNINDENVFVTRWIVKKWEWVELGQPICEIESTKSCIEVESRYRGYIYPCFEEGETAKIGDTLAWIFKKKDKKLLEEVQQEKEFPGEKIISKKAISLLKQHDLSINNFADLSVIRSDDVLKFLEKQNSKIYEYNINNLEVSENSILIYGTGNHAIVVHDTIIASGQYKPVAFLDYESRSSTLLDLPVIKDSNLQRLRDMKFKNIFTCLPNPSKEREAAERLNSMGFILRSIIHPTAVVSSTANLGENSFIGPLVVIGPEANLLPFCRILNAASVAHHCQLGVSVTIADGARLAGNVSVGMESVIGVGATVNKKINIGNSVIVVSNVGVYENVPDYSVVRNNGKIYPRRQMS